MRIIRYFLELVLPYSASSSLAVIGWINIIILQNIAILYVKYQY